MSDRDLARAALRLFQRYSREIVEGLGFCPWAAAARARGQVRATVELAAAPEAARAAHWVRELGEDPTTEIGFLLHPRAVLGRAAFEAYVCAARELYGESPGPGGVRMAVVAFHPEAPADLGSPPALVNFVRQSPDPTIQAIRLGTLAELRSREARGTTYLPPDSDATQLLADPPARPLHERVAEANFATVQRLGLAQVEALLADIRADRERTYRRLGILP